MIFSLPEKITQQNKKTTQQKLGNIALLLGYMKQKCMLILGAKEKQFLSFDAFNLIMQVITKDIKSVGFDNIAYKITKSSQISFDFAQKVNDFVFCIAKVYKFCNADAIIFVDPSKKSCSIELDAKDIQIKKIKINGLNISFSKQDNNCIRLFMEVKNV